VPALADVAQIALGERHSCARLGDGTVRCWGDNDRGAVGDGGTADRWTPTLVAW
jgi:alpha-tubulin suppressor-like RCC1 family protein